VTIGPTYKWWSMQAYEFAQLKAMKLFKNLRI